MSSPQPPDGGQQGSDPIANRMDPPDPNQAGGDATQVVRPVQSQGQQPPSDSTQVVPPSMQPPQPMYQQPGLGGQAGGAEATAMVPPSMQPPQPMYQQPGTQSQPGGFPAQQPGTPGGGFPAPQAQGGFAPPPIGPGQPAPQSQGGNKGLALTAGWIATAMGGISAIFNLIGVIGLGASYALLESTDVYSDAGLPPFGLLIVLYIGFLLSSLLLLTGGIMIVTKKSIGPILVVAASGLYAICQVVVLFTGFITGPSIFAAVAAVLVAAAIAVLAFLPGTRDYIAAAGSGAPAPAAGGYGQPQQFGQPDQQFGQPGQQFGQPGQPQQFGQPGQQPGGFPPPGGQQPPQW